MQFAMHVKPIAREILNSRESADGYLPRRHTYRDMAISHCLVRINREIPLLLRFRNVNGKVSVTESPAEIIRRVSRVRGNSRRAIKKNLPFSPFSTDNFPFCLFG